VSAVDHDARERKRGKPFAGRRGKDELLADMDGLRELHSGWSVK
jgi:hypothetical protein